MKLIRFQKVRDGKYLKNYELTYLNQAGKEKNFEIVSHHDINDVSELGQKVSGVSIVATCEGKMLLLKEFRMGVNREVYNLCAGMIKDGETMEECIARELYEEAGLKVKKIKAILPPSFAALGLCDVLNQVAFVEVEGIPNADHASPNEKILPSFYSREEVRALLENKAAFSSRAQIVAYFFSEGKIGE
ncbi:MAG: NUDIX hydrolase [Lachnospiraceae bacterium]|nr:NUDIX hydrolase [Lachnospiraceae bacterium]